MCVYVFLQARVCTYMCACVYVCASSDARAKQPSLTDFDLEQK